MRKWHRIYVMVYEDNSPIFHRLTDEPDYGSLGEAERRLKKIYQAKPVNYTIMPVYHE